MRLLYVGIDDELLMDERFKEYCLVRKKKLEDYFQKTLPHGYRVILPPGLEVADAFYECYKVYRLARKYWMDKNAPYSSIPEKDWKSQKCDDDMVVVGLVRKLEDGSYYVCGSESHFEWWKNKRKSGSKGGKAKAKNRNKALKKTSRKSKKTLGENDNSDCSTAKQRLASLSTTKHRLAEVSTFCSSSVCISNSSFSESESDPVSPQNFSSIDFSRGAAVTPLSSAPNVDINLSAKPKAKRQARDRATPTRETEEIFETFRKSKVQCYGDIRCIKNAHTDGLLLQLVDRVGFTAALRIAEVYPKLRRPHYLKRAHPLALMVHDAEALAEELAADEQLGTTSEERAMVYAMKNFRMA